MVVVVGATVVLVVVVVVVVGIAVVVLVVVVVVVTKPVIGKSTKLAQTPVDITLIIVAVSGTKFEVYPDKRLALLTPVSKGVVNPSESEYKLKLAVSIPAVVNVINILNIN